MNPAEQVDVLAVMTPRESQLTKGRDWRPVSTYRTPDMTAPAGPRAYHPREFMAVSRTVYEQVFAQVCIDDERPKQFALIEADDLDRARAAVAALLKAVDRVFYEWDNISPALHQLRAARAGITDAT